MRIYEVSKIALETKIGDIVGSEEGCLGLHWDLDQLGQWADEWQMEVNLNKMWSCRRWTGVGILSSLTTPG